MRKTLLLATMTTVTTLLTMTAAMPAWAKGPAAGPALTKLAAEYFHAHPKDLKILATAAALAEEPGGAALVRVDDGSDGGNPVCHLVTLAGRPGSPAKIEASLKYQTCPRADQGKTTLLQRVNMGHKNAWLVRLDSLRYDSMAKGGEAQLLWAVSTDMGDGAGLRNVFERLSTAFRSKEMAAVNTSEVCKQPEIKVSAGEPQGLNIACELESMMGTLVKRSQQTFAYMWDGSSFSPK